MSWDWTRITRGLALACWGGFFAYLWLSGRATTYIGPKTAWVVTLGALTLPVVALAYLWGARGEARAVSTREVAANWLLVAPIVLALMVPAPSLGALAVKNKSAGRNAAPIGAGLAGGTVRLFEIAWAGESARYAKQVGIKSGDAVDFIGIVVKSGRDGRMLVARFFVTCCAADATAYTLTVNGAPSMPTDTWVRVQGHLTGRPGAGLQVAADSVAKIDEPSDPYN